MYPAVKRAMDIVLALVVLVLGAPVLLCVALIVWLDSPGDILFRQVRSGKDGVPFEIVKFRTMRPHRVDPFLSITPEHPLVTRVGRFLRRSKIDELPNAFNILKGEMSFVGPRPTLPEQVERYTPWQRRRLEVRPGLTGWSQIHGNTQLSWEDRIDLDIWYVQYRSLWLDMRILLRTGLVVLRGERIRPVRRGMVRPMPGRGGSGKGSE